MDIKTLANNILPLKPIKTGKILKKALGLEDYKNVYVRKALNISIPIYIVIYNSRFPNLFIPISKMKNLKALSVQRTTRIYDQNLSDFIMTPPVKLEQYDRTILSKSVIICYDMAGEYFSKDKI
jgi:hypothetical protein